MEVRVNCNKCQASILVQTFEKYNGLCKPCFNKDANIKQPVIIKGKDMQGWELKPENGHPLARQVLRDDFFWSLDDENSPLGNDDGADTLQSFYKWLKGNPTIDRKVFLDKVLAGWEVNNDKWDLLTNIKIKNEMKRDDFSLITRDNVVIALAFSQIVLEGKVEKDIKQKAFWALERQQSEVVLDSWGKYKEERRERLQKMKRVLETFKELE